MSKIIHGVNPPNVYLQAKLDAWHEYTTAYHNDAPRHVLMHLYDAYEQALCEYAENPQQVFHLHKRLYT